LRDVFDLLLTEIFKLTRQFLHNLIVNPARNADAAWVSQAFQTRCNVHPIAENVAILQHDVADVDANAKLHASVFRQVFVQLAELLLDVDSALNRGQGTGEGGENAVSGGPANPSAVLRDAIVGDRPKF
jgi:hypothetical protein